MGLDNRTIVRRLGRMNNTIEGTVSTSAGSDGVTLELLDGDHCILARLHLDFEAWGRLCSMSCVTKAEVQLHAPVLEKHLVRICPEKAPPKDKPATVDPLAIPLWVDADVLRLVKARILRAAYYGSPRFAGALPNTPEYTNRIQLVLNGLPSLRAMDDPSIDLTLKAIVLDAIEVEGVNVPREVYEHFRICPLPKDKIEAMVDR